MEKTDKERKEYLGEERMRGIYQQYPYCCVVEVEEYQMKLEYYDPTSINREDDVPGHSPKTIAPMTPTGDHQHMYKHSFIQA